MRERDIERERGKEKDQLQTSGPILCVLCCVLVYERAIFSRLRSTFGSDIVVCFD